MRKPLKNKKDKVPKITESEYSEYISRLRGNNGNIAPIKENLSDEQNATKKE